MTKTWLAIDIIAAAAGAGAVIAMAQDHNWWACYWSGQTTVLWLLIWTKDKGKMVQSCQHDFVNLIGGPACRKCGWTP